MTEREIQEYVKAIVALERIANSTPVRDHPNAEQAIVTAIDELKIKLADSLLDAVLEAAQVEEQRELRRTS
jgi:hypothetical protein